MPEKLAISVMALGVATAVGEDLEALEALRDTLANGKYTVSVQNPEYPNPSPAGSMTGAGIVLRDIAADDERLKSAVKHVYKGTRRWLRKRFADSRDARELHITIWSKDAERLKEIRGSSDKPFEDVTPESLKLDAATPLKPASLWDTFNDFTWFTRMFLIASLLLGLVMLAYLWATDANIDVRLGSYDLQRPAWLLPYNAEWLNGHAYIPNILAGATGFLIGAPFALIVLATFTVQREERAALDRVNKLSALAWNTFRDSVLDLCSQERMFTGLKSDAHFASELHDQIFREYQRRIGIAQTRIPDENRFHGAPEDEVVEFQQYLRERSEVMGKYMSRTLKSVGAQYQLQIKWSIIRTNWNTLNQYARLQRLERNLEWFNAELDAEFMNRLSDSQHPLTEFMRLHEIDRGTSTASLSAALAVINRDKQMSHEEVAKKLMAGYTGGGSGLMHPNYYYEFGYKQVEGHEEAADAAHRALWDLQRVVNDVERDSWPTKFTRPVEPR